MDNIEEYLNQIPMWAAKKNTLEDIREYLKVLGNPDESMKMIHVAGTNGKGSVCAFLTSVLTEAGYKVGTFISPHLVDTKERFLMYGEWVRPETYEYAFETVRSLSDHMTAKGYAAPTYFEFLFYMSMAINAKCKPDVVILETGLGGRLDATNVIKRPVLTVLTSISMDHMAYLGDSLAQIAGEKAGILKEGVPVVYDANCPEASAVIEQRAEELGCPLYPTAVNAYTLMSQDEPMTKLSVRTLDGGQLVVAIPSIAEYQWMNATLAIRALDVLRRTRIYPVTASDIIMGMKGSYWPGRMEEVLPGLYLDGAHNEGGIAAFARTAARMQQGSGRKIHLLFAAVLGKDYEKMIAKLCQTLELTDVLVAQMETERTLDTALLAEEFEKEVSCPVERFADVEAAWKRLMSVKDEEDLAFCIGSLYLIGEIKQILRRNRHD